MRTHPLNIAYLVVGLIFLGLSGSWALRESGVVDLGEAEWLLPVTLVIAGSIGLVAFAAKSVSGRPSPDENDHAAQPYNSDYEGDIR